MWSSTPIVPKPIFQKRRLDTSRPPVRCGVAAAFRAWSAKAAISRNTPLRGSKRNPTDELISDAAVSGRKPSTKSSYEKLW